ncbi:MAG: hypothetical protein M3Q52_04875 [Pseudomonadota bacterium]|nr:hypothetical protein [Pseudomonadota bacterium]
MLLFGAMGGVLNALVTDNGFFLPAKQDVEGRHLWRPGFVGNIIAGAGAALVSWGMYGPLIAEVIVPLYEIAPSVAAASGTPAAPPLPPAAPLPTTPVPPL